MRWASTHTGYTYDTQINLARLLHPAHKGLRLRHVKREVQVYSRLLLVLVAILCIATNMKKVEERDLRLDT
jgi:hypothetical protein